MEEVMPEFEGHTLLTETLRVFNQALARHADEQPFREILTRVEKLGRLRLGVAVYEGDAPVPVDHYGVEMHEGKFHVVSRGQRELSIDWRVSVDYLRRVTAHPSEYIEEPARLELGWLEQRLGIR
jgi:hypothetical protein